jgi:hypothetical protein
MPEEYRRLSAGQRREWREAKPGQAFLHWLDAQIAGTKDQAIAVAASGHPGAAGMSGIALALERVRDYYLIDETLDDSPQTTARFVDPASLSALLQQGGLR